MWFVSGWNFSVAKSTPIWNYKTICYRLYKVSCPYFCFPDYYPPFIFDVCNIRARENIFRTFWFISSSVLFEPTLLVYRAKEHYPASVRNMADEKERFWKPQKNVCYSKWKNWYIHSDWNCVKIGKNLANTSEPSFWWNNIETCELRFLAYFASCGSSSDSDFL